MGPYPSGVLTGTNKTWYIKNESVITFQFFLDIYHVGIIYFLSTRVAVLVEGGEVHGNYDTVDLAGKGVLEVIVWAPDLALPR